MTVTAGDEAPDFDLPGDGGRRLSLADFHGRKLVLYFYPQDDTETCTIEAMDFNRLKAKFAAADTAIVGVSPDAPKSHERFKKKYGLKFDLASDEKRVLIGAYGLWIEKNMFGRTYMGVERATFLIDSSGRIARIWRKVRAKGHAEAVLEAAKSL